MVKVNSIIGHENIKDYYFITTCGKIISTSRGRVGLLKDRVAPNGYMVYSLRKKDGLISHAGVHRLVAFAYCKKEYLQNQVNHMNEIKTDNFIGNLEWCTHEYNQNYGNRSTNASLKLRGGNNYKSKTKDHWRDNKTRRVSFKRTCLRMGWIFSDFIEIFSGERYKANRSKLYFYKLKK